MSFIELKMASHLRLLNSVTRFDTFLQNHFGCCVEVKECVGKSRSMEIRKLTEILGRDDSGLDRAIVVVEF